MQIHTPADKRFRRSHVRPAKRRRARAIVWVVLRVAAAGALLGYSAHRGGDLIVAAGFLNVDRLVVRGNSRLSTGELMAAVGDLRGQNILALDLAVWQRRLAALPWVAEATLRRVLPSTIEIEVVERRPIGLARIDGRLFLVDGEGVIIDEHGPQSAGFDLPIVDGLAARRGTVEPVVDLERAQLAARVIAALSARPSLAGHLSQINVRDARDAVVLLDGDTTLIHLGTDRFVERIQSYLELAPTLRTRVPSIDSVDLRFDERVYVRPARGAAGRTSGDPPNRSLAGR